MSESAGGLLTINKNSQESQEIALSVPLKRIVIANAPLPSSESSQIVPPTTEAFLGERMISGTPTVVDDHVYELPVATAISINGSRGSTAEIFKGITDKKGKSLIVKVFHRAQAQKDSKGNFTETASLLIQAYWKELHAIMQLNHPHIIEIRDAVVIPAVGRWNESIGFVEEELQPLKVDEMSGNDAVSCIGQMADALDYAHSQHVIHYDVKPANILFDPEAQLYKLADFGAAKKSGVSEKQISMTPNYADPQVCAGKYSSNPELNKRADQYSLAATALAFLLKRADLKDCIAVDVNASKVFIAPTLQIDEKIRIVLEKALSYNREDRYDSCTAFFEAFKQAVGSSQESAPAANFTPIQVSEAEDAGLTHELNLLYGKFDGDKDEHDKAA